ncbi:MULTISPECIES: DUF3658 domain-containing protein [unclassified Burkholderia]|uniref:DUF3658 domain-containing protein n=1 Tax=unclassified Burkholderia TaxID=2613784 RepID=UPI001E4B4EC3|nr:MULTISPECIES: DUF3658 domain-containing protein [unclassified Burkholderia]UEP31034.1 DUF3658 domain-containing protein [Burkholderia sp. B21-007]UEP43688.1 DUF3658 domain-containing protein [Burkholderia sp. B21-005]
MIQNKHHQNVVHATFSKLSFDAVSSAISNGSLTGSCVLIGGDWHLGPLKERNTKTLSAWFSENFGYVPANLSTNTRAIGKGARIFAWANPLASDEYANFIHWVSSRVMQEFSFIPLPESAPDSAAGNFHDIAFFLDDAVEKKASDINHYIREWNVLTGENADFRLIGRTGKIESLPSSHFDKDIIDTITREWEPCSIVALRIMEKLDSEKQAFPGDIFLYHRFEKLCSSGFIEKQADVSIVQTLIRAMPL